MKREPPSSPRGQTDAHVQPHLASKPQEVPRLNRGRDFALHRGVARSRLDPRTRAVTGLAPRARRLRHRARGWRRLLISRAMGCHLAEPGPRTAAFVPQPVARLAPDPDEPRH